MTYTIGVGALLEGEAFNAIRSLELLIANMTANFRALDQPPHITVKRPFTVPSEEDLEKVKAILVEVCSHTEAFDVQYVGVGAFGNKTLYLEVEQPIAALHALHTTLLSRLTNLYDAEAPFEGNDVKFHTTIAGLHDGQLELADKAVRTKPAIGMKATVSKLALFLGLDDSSRWIVIAEQALKQRSA